MDTNLIKPQITQITLIINHENQSTEYTEYTESLAAGPMIPLRIPC